MAKPVRWFYYPACLQGRARRRLRLLQSGSDSDSDDASVEQELSHRLEATSGAMDSASSLQRESASASESAGESDEDMPDLVSDSESESDSESDEETVDERLVDEDDACHLCREAAPESEEPEPEAPLLTGTSPVAPATTATAVTNCCVDIAPVSSHHFCGCSS